MQERNTQEASELKPPTSSSYPPHAPQDQEKGWVMALKIAFWLLLVPSAVLLLFKWLMPA